VNPGGADSSALYDKFPGPALAKVARGRCLSVLMLILNVVYFKKRAVLFR
jgi:hypothetical protein